MAPRDVQRSRLYKAERVTGLHTTRGTLTFEEVVVFASDAYRWGCKQVNKQPRPLVITPRRDGKLAYVIDENRIVLPRWSWQPLLVLHEVAHLLVSNRHPAHGRRFCYVYLRLVRKFLGLDAARELRSAFQAFDVTYR